MIGNEPQDLQNRVMTKRHAAPAPGFGPVRGARGRQGPYQTAHGMPRTQAYTSWDKAEEEAAKTEGAEVWVSRFARGKPINVPDVKPAVPSGHRVGVDNAFQPVDPASLAQPPTNVGGTDTREPGYRFSGAGYDEPMWGTGTRRAQPETADEGPEAKRHQPGTARPETTSLPADTSFHSAGPSGFAGINLNDLRPSAHNEAAASFMSGVQNRMESMPRRR